MEEIHCSGLSILKLLGGKWKMPIIWVVSQNKGIRYNQLKRSLPGITNTSLTRALKELESGRIIQRQNFNTIPPHVEYSLTEITKEIVPAFQMISKWGKEKLDLE